MYGTKILTKLGVGFLLGTALYGCGPEKPIRTWSKTSQSPNGNVIARARLGAVGGFGTAFDWINVAVMSNRFPWTTVISFSIDRLTVGPDSVKLKWINNSHLDVRYCYKVKKVLFHIKNIDNVMIVLHRGSSCILR
jgi:hypothetical protein